MTQKGDVKFYGFVQKCDVTRKKLFRKRKEGKEWSSGKKKKKKRVNLSWRRSWSYLSGISDDWFIKFLHLLMEAEGAGVQQIKELLKKELYSIDPVDEEVSK